MILLFNFVVSVIVLSIFGISAFLVVLLDNS
jgi:hypothetical protein